MSGLIGPMLIAVLLASAQPQKSAPPKSKRASAPRSGSGETKKPGRDRAVSTTEQQRSSDKGSQQARPKPRPSDEPSQQARPKPRSSDEPSQRTKPPRSDEALMLQNREFLEMLELLIDLPMIAEDDELETDSKEPTQE
ncbi:MAG: hypothetical protein AAFP04_06310 [Myxococcota bacterium]